MLYTVHLKKENVIAIHVHCNEWCWVCTQKGGGGLFESGNSFFFCTVWYPQKFWSCLINGGKRSDYFSHFCWSQCCLSYFSFRLCCKKKTLSNANAVRALGRRKKVFHSISYLLSFFPIGCVCCRLLRRLCRLKRSGAYVLVSVDLWSHRLLHFLFPIPNSTDSLKHHNSQASRSVSVPYWELIDFSARVHSKSGSFFFTPPDSKMRSHVLWEIWIYLDVWVFPIFEKEL